MKDDRLYLIHIQECLGRIADYTASGKEAFFADPKTQDAVLRNLQTLAESTQRLSRGLRSKHPQVDWRAIGGFRNVAVHDYLGIDLKQVWEIVEHDLPDLRRDVRAMLQELQGPP